MIVIDFGVIIYAMEIINAIDSGVNGMRWRLPSLCIGTSPTLPFEFILLPNLLAGLRLTADRDMIYSRMTFIALSKIDNRLKPVGGEICR